ncbi:MAG TPA: DUF1223 domain-containing protein [Xanthobacteraceae bacterium]|jgi:hypothetical protein|nr:DUF1223 domain-containing protein [Xanthobacteraceae bacterium]
MVRLRVISSFALACLAVFLGRPAHAEPRAVIELFTSQGCSSCPPADKLIAEYSRDPSVIALSLAVDYWDYLGWKDTLALHGHSMRQRAYAKARGDRQVYTPQAVIDGVMHALGSDKAAIERAIGQTQEQRSSLTVPVTMTQSGDMLTIKVPDAPDRIGTVQAEVWLCPITKSVHVTIERGENTGHTFTYTNVVRRWIKVGDWSGKAETFDVSVKDFQNGAIDSAAVMVQSGVSSAPKLILGAAQIPIQ